MTFQICDWNKLFPKDGNGDTVITQDRLNAASGLIARYLSIPMINPTDRNGNMPALLQNFQTPADLELNNYRKSWNRVASMQNLAPTDYNQFWSNLQRTFIAGNDVFDNNYMLLFDKCDLNGNDFYEIQTATTSVIWKKTPYGGSVDYYSGTDSRTVLYIDWYSAGIEIDMRTIMTRKFKKIETDIQALRNAYYVKKASVFYALIEAVNASENIAWQAPIPAGLAATDRFYYANRDAMTIAKAIQTIIADCKLKGYSGDLTKETYYVLYDVTDDVRLRMASNVTMDTGPGGSTKILGYNVIFLPTQSLSASTYYYTILPKRNMTYGEALELSLFNQFNQSNYTQQTAGWAGFGGAISDIKQVKRCLKS